MKNNKYWPWRLGAIVLATIVAAVLAKSLYVSYTTVYLTMEAQVVMVLGIVMLILFLVCITPIIIKPQVLVDWVNCEEENTIIIEPPLARHQPHRTFKGKTVNIREWPKKNQKETTSA